MSNLIVDGMLSGTGVRDAVEAGSLNLDDLGISTTLASDLTAWVGRYESQHYRQFKDADEVAALDSIGIELQRRMKQELPESKIQYFSLARMEMLVLIDW